MKKKSNTQSTESASLKVPESVQTNGVIEETQANVQLSKNKTSTIKIEKMDTAVTLSSAPSLTKAAVKLQLKEAKKFFRYTRRLLKKAKKVFKKTSRKKDPSLYEIVKFNFHEAKRRKKEQKSQVSELKKAYRVVKKQQEIKT